MLISPEYQALNRLDHETCQDWGTGAKHYADMVRQVSDCLGTKDILDYGCGKGHLGKLLGYPIKEYDPGIPGKDGLAEPAMLVVCASVLEHIEPEYMDNVLRDLRRCIKHCGFFIIPHNLAVHFLPDGRNSHISAHPRSWWDAKLSEFFRIHSAVELQAVTSETPGEIVLGSRTHYIVF